MTMQPARLQPNAQAARGLFATLAGMMIQAGDLLPADPHTTSRCPGSAGILREANPARLSTGQSPWQMRRVQAVIAARIGEAISNRELAAEVRLSVSHFARAFRRSFGHAPHAYVLARRVAHAKHLMSSTEDPLAQVAVSCGFCDQAHFSKVFRQVEKTTPHRWRAHSRAAAGAGVRHAATGWPGRARGPDLRCAPLPERRQSWM